MTAGDVVTAAFEELGVIAPGEALAADLASRGLSRLNDWIDALALESLTVTQIVRTTFTVTTASSYAVGTGATVNVSRPVSAARIHQIGLVDTTTTPAREVYVQAPLGEDAYAAIVDKAATGTPQRWYYRATLPTGTLYPYPISNGASPTTGVLYSEAPMTEFAALTDVISVAPGYRRFLLSNLAMEVAAMMEREPSRALAQRAREAKGWVKRANVRARDLGFAADALQGTGRRSSVWVG